MSFVFVIVAAVAFGVLVGIGSSGRMHMVVVPAVLAGLMTTVSILSIFDLGRRVGRIEEQLEEVDYD
jgi:hypothetical protein